MDAESSGAWDGIANKYWLRSKPKKIDPDTLRTEIWTPLEAAGFTTRSLLPLENLQILEKFLWPTFAENVSNHQVILIAAFVTIKLQGNLEAWPILLDRPEDFSTLFQRVLSLNLDSSLPASSRLFLLNFVVGAFRSLEKDLVRKECAPLVSIALWHNLRSDEYREKEVRKSSARQKAWKSVQKRFENAGKDGQVRLLFERAWLHSMTLDFLRRVHNSQSSVDEVTFCEKYLEFLTDLTSQIPTRRYAIVLLRDLNLLPSLRMSIMYKKETLALLRDLASLYQHFDKFQIDDNGGQSSGQNSIQEAHYEALAELQSVAFQHFEEKLKVLALSNCASIDKPDELRAQLEVLSDVELQQLCDLLGFRTQYPATAQVPTGRDLFLEVLITAYSRPRDFRDVIGQLSISPTEESLYDPTLLRNENYEDSKPLALPKLNLQYLSLNDFMWRSFQLYQSEAFYEIRKDMESIVRRIKPTLSRDSRSTTFEGFSKMALPIEKPAIVDVGQPKVGSTVPSSVRAEVILDVSRLNDRIRSEWESLRPRDTIFLLSVKGTDRTNRSLSNGTSSRSDIGLDKLRTAEVVQVLDDKGRPLRNQENGYAGRPKRRHLLLDLDPVAYTFDQAQLAKSKVDVWSSINVIARRQGRENNFKPVLETVQKLVSTQLELPRWLQDVFLGYGDAKSASYTGSGSKSEEIDYLDTFMSWQHLQQSFPGREVTADPDSDQPPPPYVLRPFSHAAEIAPSNPKKRRREQMEDVEVKLDPIQVATYKPANTGPYPTNVPKRNTIQFTPNQISAIISGTQPGLTLIVGPPGTGKTDVATQIINLLYHNYSSEKVLLIAHSNQALNQLFQKMINLDIDARHLLRLGHGEEELDTETSYSKYGRVESFMENRQAFLSEVNRLAASIQAEGAHGSTCETADYFNKVFVQPAWTKFESVTASADVTTQTVIDAFPFHRYFSNAPVPELFPQTSTVEQALEIANGCKHHLNKLFVELEAIRPFEILRSPRDQANHLLVKEARIIAMTSTHAAMRRAEIADLGFHYDTLIMEEAAQITEMESFIPCAMQNPKPRTGELQLKRIVLVGDHLQNSPVVQNLALRQYANLEQSLFLRLIRLGVPTITLDQQGRCRPSIAELFNWRYKSLTNLPRLTSVSEFSHANAGFRHEFQFIDVPDYQDQGEREPTPHFIQNLGEAEYAVALFQYMRLLGYPAKSVSILATYAGQKALIRDVLEHRCKNNRLFGMPKIVTTVDKYQGEQNDYVILSMVRTKSVGYLRDVRRLTVALSRARLGLYILGRWALFENCFEMKTAMERLTAKGNTENKLEVVTGEMFPTERKLDDEVTSVEMDGLEHLGQYVYEMTQAKVKSLGGTANIMVDKNADDAGLVEEELDEDGDMEEDPLHESVI